MGSGYFICAGVINAIICSAAVVRMASRSAPSNQFAEEIYLCFL